jgi:hypothetical protein
MVVPSPEYFVVKPTAGGLPAGLPAEAAGSTGLFVVQNAAHAADPREEWDKLMREYGEDLEFAVPVMVDEQGRQSLPTGKIVVQFRDPPSGEALQQFEDSYGLRYLKTNEFRQEQLSFEARDQKAAYQPDLIARLGGDQNIKLAAPETVSQYQRV